jgi:hypothetical protein
MTSLFPTGGRTDSSIFPRFVLLDSFGPYFEWYLKWNIVFHSKSSGDKSFSVVNPSVNQRSLHKSYRCHLHPFSQFLPPVSLRSLRIQSTVQVDVIGSFWWVMTEPSEVINSLTLSGYVAFFENGCLVPSFVTRCGFVIRYQNTSNLEYHYIRGATGNCSRWKHDVVSHIQRSYFHWRKEVHCDIKFVKPLESSGLSERT